MLQTQVCQCPYCGEAIELLADASAGAQAYVEDCPVCCRPIQVQVVLDDTGDAVLQLAHEDEA